MCSLCNVFSIECVLYRMHSLQNVVSTECVLYRMCSLSNAFSSECILYRMCALYLLPCALQLQRNTGSFAHVLGLFCLYIGSLLTLWHTSGLRRALLARTPPQTGDGFFRFARTTPQTGESGGHSTVLYYRWQWWTQYCPLLLSFTTGDSGRHTRHQCHH